jgi:hypothetical protein
MKKHRQKVRATKQERFECKYIIDKTSGCWLWTGAKSIGGYGVLGNGRRTDRPRMLYAHRVSFEMYKGTIKHKFEIDHLCKVRNCVNPDHLEMVTREENILRSDWQKNAWEKQRGKTHCPYGHPYSGENLYVHKKTGKRQCQICMKRRSAEAYQRLLGINKP